MSKLVVGEVKLSSLQDAKDAATLLQWPIESEMVHSIRVTVKDEKARYRPYIDVAFTHGQGTLSYDHMMGLSRLGADDHDDVTRRVVGQFKQAINHVQVERLLKSQRASWRIEQREDGAQVVRVRR